MDVFIIKLIPIGIAIYLPICIALTSWEFDEYDFVTPRWFYNKKGLNWFGSFLVFILLSIFSPICTIIKIIYAISQGVYKGIKWLLTVGR